jgi:hypothetical protein
MYAPQVNVMPLVLTSLQNIFRPPGNSVLNTSNRVSCVSEVSCIASKGPQT